MPAGASIFEQERVGVAQIEHHHRIRNGGFRHVDAGFGDHQRGIGKHFLLVIGGLGEDDIGRLFLARGIGGLLVPIVEAALDTPRRAAMTASR